MSELWTRHSVRSWDDRKLDRYGFRSQGLWAWGGSKAVTRDIVVGGVGWGGGVGRALGAKGDQRLSSLTASRKASWKKGRGSFLL